MISRYADTRQRTAAIDQDAWMMRLWLKLPELLFCFHDTLQNMFRFQQLPMTPLTYITNTWTINTIATWKTTNECSIHNLILVHVCCKPSKHSQNFLIIIITVNYHNKHSITNTNPNWTRKNSLESINNDNNSPRKLSAVIVLSEIF